MRAPLRKAVMTYFKREFERKFPPFIQLRLPSGTPPVWAWEFARNLTFFILLQPFRSKDQFVFDIAWSDDNEFPWAVVCKTKVEGTYGRQRLGLLWTPSGGEPIWDLAPEKTAAMQADLEALQQRKTLPYPPDPPIEQILPRVEPLVDDAIQKFIQYGLPLFRRVAEHRGLSWPL